MTAPRKIHLTIGLLGLAGIALLIVLVIRAGAKDVGLAIATARWGIAAVVAFHVVPLFADAIAWWALFPRAGRPRLLTLFWMRWIGESVSNLLPVAQVGGDVVRARLAAIHGAPVHTAAASVLVDITLSVFTQTAFTLTGLALFVAATGRTALLGPILLGTLITVAAVGGFYAVQRAGMFRLIAAMVARLASSASWQSLVQRGDALDRTVRALYARRRGIVACCAWTFFSWVIGAGEVWIALHAVGVGASFDTALILESVTQGVRGAAFLVPGAVGVQEGGYVVIGGLLGIPKDSALAIALIRRVRELALGVPGLVAWQLIEGRRLWSARSPGAKGTAS
jgi:putative membrane protein